MTWVLIFGLAGLALVALAVVLLRVWKTVRALGQQVANTGDLVTKATDDLARAQAGRGGGRDGVPS